MTHYMMEKYLYNPAYTGDHYKKIEAVINNRKQYRGEQGPLTNYLAVHAPIGNNKYSIGGRVVSDKINYLYYSGLWFTGSYKFWLPKGILAVGAELGLMNRGINHNKLILTDYNDELFVSGNSINYGFSMMPDIGLGVYYTVDKFYAGVSTKHILATNFGRLKYEREIYNQLNKHYTILTGYNYKYNNDWTFEPSMLIKYTNNITDLQYDFSILAKHKKYPFGLNYRSEKAISPILSYSHWEFLTLSYSYDIQLSNFGNYFNGNHEILIRVLHDKPKPILKKEVDPRFYY